MVLYTAEEKTAPTFEEKVGARWWGEEAAAIHQFPQLCGSYELVEQALTNAVYRHRKNGSIRVVDLEEIAKASDDFAFAMYVGRLACEDRRRALDAEEDRRRWYTHGEDAHENTSGWYD